MRAAGIAEADLPLADYIFQKESGWRVDAVNSIGCIGIGQSCPNGSGLAKECPDWKTNLLCQVKHFKGYMERRPQYGTWAKAKHFWDVTSLTYTFYKNGKPFHQHWW